MANNSVSIQPPARVSMPASLPNSESGGRFDDRRDTPMENDPTRAVAERFEAAFLAEMLRHTGFGKMPESFNGGAGEAAFTGTLVQEYANRIAATGGLGIADRIYDALSERGSE